MPGPPGVGHEVAPPAFPRGTTIRRAASRSVAGVSEGAVAAAAPASDASTNHRPPFARQSRVRTAASSPQSGSAIASPAKRGAPSEGVPGHQTGSRRDVVAVAHSIRRPAVRGDGGPDLVARGREHLVDRDPELLEGPGPGRGDHDVGGVEQVLEPRSSRGRAKIERHARLVRVEQVVEGGGPVSGLRRGGPGPRP